MHADLPICPHCGAPMTVRVGITFPPLKARMFDLISDVTKGRGGIECETLAWVFFSGVPTPDAKNRVRVHINQINDLLVSTDLRIKHLDGLYQLIEIPPEDPNE